MFKKIAVAAALVLPAIVSFAQTVDSYKPPAVPEIDGSYAMLGLALVGGVLSVLKRRIKK